MNIDIRTLVIVLGIANVLQITAIFLQYRLNKAYQGIGWWVLGFTSMAVAYLFLFLRDLIPIRLITIIAANALILLGPVFTYIGVMRFLDRSENRKIIVTILAVFTAAFLYYTYLEDNITLRTGIVYGAVALVSFLTAQGLFLNRSPAITTSAYLNTALFLLNACFFAFRALVALTVDPVSSLFSPTMMQSTSFLFLFVEGILLTFGLIIMVNQRLNAEMREAKENIERIFNTSPDAVLITSLADGRFVGINDGFTALTGFTREEVVGKSSLEVNLWKNPADRDKVLAALNAGGFCNNLEAVFLRKDGTELTGMVAAKIITLKGAPHIISVTRDITDRKRSEEALKESEKRYRELSIVDDLTRLYNSRHFFHQLKLEIDRAERYRQPLTLMLLDLDDFKRFNDTYGHIEGDQVLSRLGRAVKRCLRQTDSAYRYGGEEFTILLPMTTGVEGAVTADRIRKEFRKENFSPVPGQEIHVTMSIGLGQHRVNEEMGAFVHRVDELMYQAKKIGKDGVCSDQAFSPNDRTRP